MTTKSSKAKGRRLQQFVAQSFLDMYPDGEFASVTMGLAGSDVVDPYNKLPWAYTECRSRETTASLDVIVKEMNGKAPMRGWTYISKKNRQAPVVTMDWDTFVVLMSNYFVAEE